MGAQTILNKNQENYAVEFDSKLLKYSKDLYLKEHFLVGKGVDRDKLVHALLLNTAMKATTCTMVDFIKNKISGKLDLPIKKYSSNIILEYIDYTKSSCTEAINECCENLWSDVQW